MARSCTSSYEIQRADGVINGVIDEQSQILDRLNTAQSAAKQFGELRFWLMDLAASMQNESEENADASFEQLTTQLDRLKVTDQEAVAKIQVRIAQFREVMIEGVDAYADDNRVLGNSKVSNGRSHALNVDAELVKLVKAAQKQAKDVTGKLTQNNSALLIIALVGLAAAVLVGSLLAWLCSRAISRPLKLAVEVANRIAGGDLDHKFEANSTDATGQLLRSLSTMQTNLKERNAEDRRQMAESDRIKQSLDKTTSNVLIADARNDIVYMNESVTAMFADAESDIRTDLPNFNAKTLIGANLNTFDANPAHQQRLLADLDGTRSAEFGLGGRTFRTISNPVMSHTGVRLGSVLEWVDRTQEVAVEHEVQSIVSCALAGDLTQRIVLENKHGFFETLGQGINDLVDVSERVINDTVRVMGAMSRGDLNERIDADYQGSFGQLKADANATVAKLTEIIGEVKNTSTQVMRGAEELAEGNLNLSQRTEEQAASLEKTAAAMEEMTSRVKQTASHARKADELGVGAREQAEKGGDVVGNAVKSMSDINASSKKIADIIGVIDEIAFQTNLLALNAAVEAARAGEQGRGFAVVASEVRNLAQRSATAAKEIKDLIEDSVGKVGEGTRLVDACGKTLSEIVSAVAEVGDIVAGIADTSQEQANGIEQVNKSITQMDQMTQQNAALVEEAAAASQSVGEQASELNELVGFFQVGEASVAPLQAPAERRSTGAPVDAAQSGCSRRSTRAVCENGQGEWRQ